ncbi:protein of unknown function [Caballeronia sp. S22]
MTPTALADDAGCSDGEDKLNTADPTIQMPMPYKMRFAERLKSRVSRSLFRYPVLNRRSTFLVSKNPPKPTKLIKIPTRNKPPPNIPIFFATTIKSARPGIWL